jgi:phosphate uptake regulator
METRKVQLSGGTTYTVSLPKTWAEEHGITPGSSLRIHPNDDGTLFVEATGDRELGDRDVDIDVTDDSDRVLQHRVHAAHTVGCDSVTLVDRSGHGSAQRQHVEDALRGLSGFEVLDTSEQRLQLMNLIEPENVDIRKSVLRLRLVVLAMHRDALTAIIEDNEELARQVTRRDDEADKLFAIVTRHFRRALSNLHEVEKLGRSRDELFEYYYVARQFERVADHAEKVAALTRESEVSIPDGYADQISTLGRESRDIVDESADVILEGAGSHAALETFEARDELEARLDSLDRELYDHHDPAEAYALGLLLNSLRRTAAYGTNIAEVALQQSIRERADE